jgi:hypothetical protein
MKSLKIPLLVLALVFGFTADMAGAQSSSDKAGSSMTREQVKKERDEFIKTHRYDPISENWVLKEGVESPAGMKTRAQVKAERDEFIKTHKYDEVADAWVSLKGAPKGTLTREQVRAETAQFVRTHTYDPVNETWVEKKAAKK